MAPRGLSALPIELRSEIAKKCESTTPYREIVEWLRASYGVRTSISSLGDFFQRWKRRIEIRTVAAPRERGTLHEATALLSEACDIIATIDPEAAVKLRAASFEAVGRCATKGGAR